MVKGASFYKRITILPGLLYVNLSKLGVSVSGGPRGAKLHVPVYNTSVKRTPRVWLQKSVLGTRLQYRRTLDGVADDAKGIGKLLGKDSGKDGEGEADAAPQTLEATLEGATPRELADIKRRYEQTLEGLAGAARQRYSQEYAQASIVLGYLEGSAKKESEYELSEILPELRRKAPSTKPGLDHRYSLLRALGEACGAVGDAKTMEAYLKKTR